MSSGFRHMAILTTTYNWNDFKNQVRKYQDLGYEVWVQELDASNDGSEGDRQRQREFIYKAVRACREAGVTFINFWVMRDGVGNANPYRGWFDIADYAPKPSYYGIQDALAADITVGVIEETIFESQADAHVRTDKPTTNEGTRSNFTVQYNTGDETQFRSFLRFNISGLSDKTIMDIKLRMKVRTGDTNAHFEVRKVTGDWSETEITWDNQPDFGSTSYGSYTPASAPARQVWMKADLDPSLITEDGNLDIVLYPISSGSTEDLLFNSQETKSDPQLVVTYEMGGAVNIDDPENAVNLPTTITLEQNYPNPFNPQTHIRYGLPASADVQLKIYDVLGRLVKTLVNNQQSAGNYKVIWNGLDNGNNQVSSGVYFYNLQAKAGNKNI